VVSNQPDYLQKMRVSAAEFYPQTQEIDEEILATRFPYFRFPSGVSALYQPTHGGHLNPREHIKAQNKALELAGGTVVDDIVKNINRLVVRRHRRHHLFPIVLEPAQEKLLHINPTVNIATDGRHGTFVILL